MYTFQKAFWVFFTEWFVQKNCVHRRRNKTDFIPNLINWCFGKSTFDFNWFSWDLLSFRDREWPTIFNSLVSIIIVWHLTQKFPHYFLTSILFDKHKVLWFLQNICIRQLFPSHEIVSVGRYLINVCCATLSFSLKNSFC